MREVIIIGSGPAGLTAAIYAVRANLKPLVVSGITPGGQLTITTDVENYPGFPEGITGPALMENMRSQAERLGAEFAAGDISKADLLKTPFAITVGEDEYTAKAIIIATGASAKMLGLESESRYMGKGVSACATCDGFFFREKEVFVIGGGDTALEEALFLTKFASKVTVVHRRDKFRASKIMQDKAFSNKKIAFKYNSVATEILGNSIDGVVGIELKNVKDNICTRHTCQGVFIAIGHSPNTALFKGMLDMDKSGYIITQDGTKTNIPGVFAAGDVQDRTYRQAVTAAGSGCMAAIDAEKYLESL